VQGQPSHLSLDAGVIHGHTILDYRLVRNAPTDADTDYVLYRSVEVIESTQDCDMMNTVQVTESLREVGIHVASIVGDGFSSQVRGLSPSSDTSIPNSEEWIRRCPAVRPIMYICCSCNLPTLALNDAPVTFSFL
jgi:hypothetical protein